MALAPQNQKKAYVIGSAHTRKQLKIEEGTEQRMPIVLIQYSTNWYGEQVTLVPHQGLLHRPTVAFPSAFLLNCIIGSGVI
jgi:hypothetical protein